MASPVTGAGSPAPDSLPVPEDQNESHSSSSSNSPAPADNEESDFFLANNDSQSSLGVINLQDMNVDDQCLPPINRLPNEIFLAIFSKLSSTNDIYHCLLVSRRWARNAVDLLWHRPACTNWAKHSSICQTLGMANPYFPYHDFIKRLNLASLAEDVNDGSIMPLSVCTRVERLTLTNCKQITDRGLIALVENSSSLLAIDISNDRNITEQSILAMAEHCKRLQGLNISGCEQISNDSMITLAQNCKYIKRLKLNECSQLSDDAIYAFAENCPNILEIDLQQCRLIGNGPITSLLANGNCLRELRLVNCDLVDDNAFLPLSSKRKFEHLRILDLTSCTRLTDAAVQKIVEAAPRLRNLVLAKCGNITDVAVNAISTLGKNLHYVHFGHCRQITDQGVKNLVNACNRIRYIDLGCCTNLTDESVKRLAFLPKLKRIGLVKCANITDESVFALADAAYRPRMRRDAHGAFIGGEYFSSSLERVHLSYCLNLTLKSILRLLNSCPRLTHLSLTGVVAFQREEFQPYCRQAPPEFTQHQRDVFCVFSGHQVGKFREFLNTSPLFIEERRSLPPAWGSQHRPSRRAPQAMPTGGAAATGVSDGPEDEVYDDDNDYEGMDTVAPPVMPHFAHQHPLPLNEFTATPHFLHMPASMSGPAFAPGGADTEGTVIHGPGGVSSLNPFMGATQPNVTHSSFILGHYPPGLHAGVRAGGHDDLQASVATLQAATQSSGGGPAPTGASSAPLHGRPESEGSG
ncbi:RNI-like protein [Sarocladium strictum]